MSGSSASAARAAVSTSAAEREQLERQLCEAEARASAIIREERLHDRYFVHATPAIESFLSGLRGEPKGDECPRRLQQRKSLSEIPKGELYDSDGNVDLDSLLALSADPALFEASRLVKVRRGGSALARLDARDARLLARAESQYARSARGPPAREGWASPAQTLGLVGNVALGLVLMFFLGFTAPTLVGVTSIMYRLMLGLGLATAFFLMDVTLFVLRAAKDEKIHKTRREYLAKTAEGKPPQGYSTKGAKPKKD